MTLQIIGAGVGRTGTYSLKLALNQLGVGPCHHMEEVIFNMPVQVPLWQNIVKGNYDWRAAYQGYASAVDWPTAAYFRELHQAFPTAKFILTQRSAESWAESFGSTIYKALAERHVFPAEMQDWLQMVNDVVARTGFPPGLDHHGLMQAFNAHNAAVKAAIPASQLLLFQVKEGWEPLCRFLGKPVPAEPFPRTNDRVEFWDRISGQT